MLALLLDTKYFMNVKFGWVTTRTSPITVESQHVPCPSPSLSVSFPSYPCPDQIKPDQTRLIPHPSFDTSQVYGKAPGSSATHNECTRVMKNGNNNHRSQNSSHQQKNTRPGPNSSGKIISELCWSSIHPSVHHINHRNKKRVVKIKVMPPRRKGQISEIGEER